MWPGRAWRSPVSWGSFYLQMPMSRYLSCSLLVALWAVACGGSTDDSNPNPSGGSTSTTGGSAGSSTAGQSSGGSASGGTVGTGGSTNTAGTTAGGSAGNGGSSTGGVVGTSGSGGAGGTTGVDPRCPPKAPSGTCTAEQADALCNYELSSGCLCSMASPRNLCIKVDGACPGGGGEGAPPPDGAAGSTAKIALPATRACRCSGGNWQCSP